MKTNASAASENPKLRLVNVSNTLPGTWLMKIITRARPRNMSSRASRPAGAAVVSLPAAGPNARRTRSTRRARVKTSGADIGRTGQGGLVAEGRLLGGPAGKDALLVNHDLGRVDLRGGE